MSSSPASGEVASEASGKGAQHPRPFHRAFARSPSPASGGGKITDATMPQRYLDDFTVGEVFESSPHTLTEKHFAAFAEITGDAHPLHYNPDYARGRGWDAPLAHGLLLFGLCALGAAPISRELTDSMVAML